MLVIPVDRGGGTYLQTRGRVAVPTPVRESKGRHGTRLHVNTLAGHRILEEGQALVLARRMFDGACQLALEAADAPFRIDEHGLHGVSPALPFGGSNALCPGSCMGVKFR